MPGDVKRAVRVAERLREEIAVLLAREIRDPRLQGVIVSRVEMPDDLKSARVYVRQLEGAVADARKKEMLDGLARAANVIRREVGTRLSLRYAPELRFYFDEGEERRARIEELLFEVKREEATRKREP